MVEYVYFISISNFTPPPIPWGRGRGEGSQIFLTGLASMHPRSGIGAYWYTGPQFVRPRPAIWLRLIAFKCLVEDGAGLAHLLVLVGLALKHHIFAGWQADDVHARRARARRSRRALRCPSRIQPCRPGAGSAASTCPSVRSERALQAGQHALYVAAHLLAVVPVAGGLLCPLKDELARRPLHNLYKYRVRVFHM